MKEYKDIFVDFIKNPKYIVPLIIVAIAGFGYLLMHSTINVDVLSAERYFEGTELIAQSRLMGPIIEKIFNVMNYSPFFVDFLAVLFLISATTLFCTLFKKIAGKKINIVAYTIFSCLFISYPLMMEAFTYTPMSLSLALAFNFTVISLILALEYVNYNKIKNLIISTIFIWMAISLYESFATVYLMGVASVILIKILYADKEKLKLKEHIIFGIKYIIPLAIAIVFNFLITSAILSIFNIKQSSNSAKEISYTIIGLIRGIKYLISTVIIDYDISALAYLPITILLACRVISLIMGTVLSVKRKDSSIILIMIAMNLTILSLSIIQGQSARYRTCQQFQLFVAVIFMIIIQITLGLNVKKWIKNSIIALTCLVIFYQVKDMYKWEYVNDLRYQKEKQDAILIGNEIESKYDYKNKPIVFVGDYDMPSNVKQYICVDTNSLHFKVLKYFVDNFSIKKIKDIENYQYTQTNVQSYIEWGITAFINERTPNVELIKFFNWLGYDFKLADCSAFTKECKTKDENPQWPQEGAIYETEEYIVVNF